MYKIMENNQIIDVMKEIKFVKYLPSSKRSISVDERQANGCLSSNCDEVYHIYGTPNTFADKKRTVKIEEIDAEEYNTLTTQLKENQRLEKRVAELERIIKELYAKL